MSGLRCWMRCSAGWHNYSLFMREDGTLFGYLETPNFEEARRKMSETQVNSRWQTEMAPYFEGTGGKDPDQSFLFLEEVFHID